MRILVLAVSAVLVLCSHTLYLTVNQFFLEPNVPVELQLHNGGYRVSENSVDASRMADVTVLGNKQRQSLDSESWRVVDSSTVLSFTTGGAGTYVAGISIKPRSITLDAAKFNDYLAHEGSNDLLEARKLDNELLLDATEQYAKHVKAIFQVGTKLSDDWETVLGYPIEFMPLSNPYALHLGENLRVMLMYDGQPLANHEVYVGQANTEKPHSHSHDGEHGHEHTHEHANDSGHEHPQNAMRTDAEGIVEVPLTAAGEYHLSAIRLVKSTQAGLTHQSDWATLTFGVTDEHMHAHDDHSHAHDDDDHDHESHIPSYVYWLGSMAIVLGLFVYFKSRT